MGQCAHVAASVIGAFVVLNSVTGSWPARYVTPIKEPVFGINLKTVNLRITADTVVTFGSQFKRRQVKSLSLAEEFSQDTDMLEAF
jgi:hypothetical protein